MHKLHYITLHYITLHNITLHYTASEAYCERVFSLSGDLTARKRHRTTKSLDRNVFLKINNLLLKREWHDYRLICGMFMVNTIS